MRNPLRPRILILTTGGTIAATRHPNHSGYTAGQLDGPRLLAALPSPPDVDCECERVFSIGSQDMDERHWGQLWTAIGNAVSQENVDGVVVTHGTDTMEETAFFLDLALHTSKPVVLVGAMRPADAPDADGPSNLRDAIVTAASPNSSDRGVMVIVRGRIHAAAHVTKTHTRRLDALATIGESCLGQVDGNQPVYWHPPRPQSAAWYDYKPGRAMPKVDILTQWAGAGTHLLEASLVSGVEGIVIAGVGNGNMSKTWLDRLAALARQGIRVVRASRTAGPVDRDIEVNDSALGFVAGGDLPPAKARILLAACLARGLSIADTQAAFDQFRATHP